MKNKLPYELQKRIEMPGGGSVVVTIGSHEPIIESGHLALRTDAATGMAECLKDLADAFRPAKISQEPTK